MKTSTENKIASPKYVANVTRQRSAFILCLLPAPMLLLITLILVTLILVAPKLAYADPVSIELNYHCTYPLIGVQPMSVIVNSDMPDSLAVGQSTGAFDLDAIATAKGNTWTGLNIVSATSLEGTANSSSNISGNNLSLDLDVPLTIAQQSVPAENGDFDLIASGQTPPLTFSELNIGELAITVGDIDLALLARKADGSPVIFAESDPSTGIFPAPCTLDAGQDNVLHRFTITAAEPDPTADIAVTPSAVGFADTQVGTTNEVAVTVSNQGNADLVIDSINISGTDASEYFQSNNCATVSAAQTCTVTVSFSPSVEGPRTALLNILSNDADTPAVTVALSGQGVFAAEPRISLSTSQINFGDVQAGVSEDIILTINNTGTATLLINGMVDITGVDSSEFFQNNNCTTISAGAQCTVTISFTPSGEGIRAATLSVTSNDADSPISHVMLMGQGIFAPQPEILISPTALSFGELPAGSSTDLSVTVSNNGTAPLTINNLFIDGTNATEFFHTDNCSTVAVGTNCSVVVTFTPSGNGHRTASLTVQSDDPDSPTLKVALTGQATLIAEPELTLSAASIDFNTVQIGSNANRMVTVTNNGTAELNISNIALVGSDASEFAQTNNCAVVAPAENCALSITFSPASEGEKSATINIASNDPSNPNAVISISAQGTSQPQPNIAVAPSTLSFTTTLVGEARQIIVTVANVGDAPLTISQFTIAGDNAAAFSQSNDCSTIAVFSICTLTATFTPNESGSLSATLTISSNDPDSPSLNVPLSGIAELTAQPIISINHDALAFDATPLNDTSSQTLVISNIGTLPLSVALSLSGVDASSFFQMDDGNCSAIAPSDSCSVTVSFSPTIEGEHAATLQLFSNAPSAAELEISLSGSGLVDLNPKISVSPSTLDFGDTDITRPISLTTVITNTGSDQLTINSIAITGTNGLDYSLEHDSAENSCATIPVSESCTVNVTFSPLAQGIRHATLTIHSNDQDNALVSVSLLGNAIEAAAPDLNLNSTTLLFAATTVGQHSTLTITASNLGTAILNINNVAVSGTDTSSFVVSHNCSPLAAAASCEISVSFSPISVGIQEAALTLTSNDPDTPTAVIPLSGSGVAQPAPNLTVSSTALAFGTHQIGTSADLTIIVSNTGTANLELTNIAISGAPSFSQTNNCTAVTASATCSIEITFTPTTTIAETATLRLTSNDIDNATLNIRLDGQGAAIPVPVITASAADFGDVFVSEIRQRNITLHNAGSANLIISNVAIAGADSASFSSEGNCDITLAPSQDCTLAVIYTPVTVGSVDAALIIASNDPSNASLVVPLIAAGLALPQPRLTISTGALNFGDVTPGNAKQLTLIAENTGSTTLSLTTSVTGTDLDSYFPFENDPCRSLQPSETCTIHVSFAPANSGLKSAELHINSAAAPIYILLNGNGSSLDPASPPPTREPAAAPAVGEQRGGVGSFNTFMFLLLSLLILRLSTRRNPLAPRYRRRQSGD